MATQPVYLLLGDSLTLASALTSAYTTALADPVYTTGDRGALQQIWDYEDQAVENYIAHTNSHGGGTRIPPAPYTGAGPEFSLLAKLEARHSTDGVVMVKRSSVSATLIAEGTGWVGDPVYSAGRWAKSVSGENWDEFQADVTAAMGAINGSPPTLGEVKGIFVALGTNDMAVAGGGDLFTNALEQFVTDLRASYGTASTPVVWVLPQIGTDVSIAAEVTKVRAAITSREAADEQLRLRGSGRQLLHQPREPVGLAHRDDEHQAAGAACGDELHHGDLRQPLARRDRQRHAGAGLAAQWRRGCRHGPLLRQRRDAAQADQRHGRDCPAPCQRHRPAA
jgi:hypothetical protein